MVFCLVFVVVVKVEWGALCQVQDVGVCMVLVGYDLNQ